MAKAARILLLLGVAVTMCGAQDRSSTRSVGTTYLPLDHWAYPVLERAIASGALPEQFLGQRPWTRTAIAKLLLQRREEPAKYSDDAESSSMTTALENEFAPEMRQLEGESVRDARVENVYARLTGIGGIPLRDSYHVGESITNDFGRPYGEGVNAIAGATGRAEYGPFAIALRGEFQHAPTSQLYDSSQLAVLAQKDLTPVPVLPNNESTDHFHALDSYVSATWKRLYVSFGKESQWWGPGGSAAMLYSNNVDPLYMFKVDLAQPVTLPWVFRYLGPIRIQLFNGKLKEHLYPRQPYLHGEKISLMPTPNLELGFSRTVVWAGFGHPITLHSVARTYLSVGDSPNADLPGNDAGDRRGGFDVRYKVPGLRKTLTAYVDSFVDDDPSPLAAPNRSAFHPGIYFSHLPGLPKLDLRAEGAYTDLPTEPNYGGDFFYFNTSYRDGYTQRGLLLGDWVGRDGKGGELSTTYWMTPKNTVQVYWRNHMIAREFIPGGAHRNDLGTNVHYWLGRHVEAKGTFQFETYNIPFVAPGRKSDVTVSGMLVFWPSSAGQK